MKSMYRTVAFLPLTLVLLRSGPPVQAAAISSSVHVPQRFLALLATPDPLAASFQAASDAKKPSTPQPDIPLPEGKGRDLTKKLCGTCHSNNVWAIQKHTAEKWSSIIDNMVSKGLEASDDELATVNDYLAANFAPPSKDTTPPATAPPANH
jgi:hypothetical protein